MTTLASDLRSSTGADHLQLLHIYLRDHDAAASGGLRLARQCWKANRGTPYSIELHRLVTDIRRDRDALRQICSTFRVRLSRLGRSLAFASAVAGRVKTNGRAFRYSPLTRVIELEALSGGVMTKLRLWQTLMLLAEVDTRLDRTALARHVTAANEQLEVIGKLHGMAVDEALGGHLRGAIECTEPPSRVDRAPG